MNNFLDQAANEFERTYTIVFPHVHDEVFTAVDECVKQFKYQMFSPQLKIEIISEVTSVLERFVSTRDITNYDVKIDVIDYSGQKTYTLRVDFTVIVSNQRWTFQHIIT